MRLPRPGSQLKLGLECRQWRAQLVAGICDESALPRECLLQPVKQAVRGNGKRRNLVARARNPQPGVGIVLGDLIKPPAHPLHRSQRGPG